MKKRTIRSDIQSWRKRFVDSVESGVDTAIIETPAIIADLATGGGDTIQRALKGLLNGSGIERSVYNSLYHRILSKMSDKINSHFTSIKRGEEGGLVYPISNAKNGGFIVSRAMASLLNTITSHKKQMMPFSQFVLALLHERVWQCKDSSQFMHELRKTQAGVYLAYMQRATTDIVDIARECYLFALYEIKSNELTLKDFKESNPGIDIQSVIVSCERRDDINAQDILTMAFLILTPQKLIESYINAICQSGDGDIHYLPYATPLHAPNRDAPPMLAKSNVRHTDSPGLAVNNIVLIKPNQQLNTNVDSFDELEWPYGREWSEGYIQLEPPFSLYMCDGKNGDQPDWIDSNRSPDITCVHHRDHETTFNDYLEYAKISSNCQSPD